MARAARLVIDGACLMDTRSGQRWPSGGGATAMAWDDITGKPVAFSPEVHAHQISECTGLQDALDAKSDVGHSHPGGSEAFPVGAVFIAVVATNPATLLGYGTWSAFAAGRVLVGLDAGQTEFDVVEETGGAKTHTLTVTEMPAHTHVQNAHQHGLSEGTTDGAGSFMDRSNAAAATTAVTDNATAVNQNTGGGGAHNNLQPYVVVYMWKRTA